LLPFMRPGWSAWRAATLQKSVVFSLNVLLHFPGIPDMARLTLMHVMTAGVAVCTAAASAAAQQVSSKSDTIVALQARAYDGQFRPMQQRQGGVQMATPQRVYGSVKIAFRESNERSNVNLTINTTLQQSEILGWSANPGQCGSGSVPFMPIAQFPVIEVNTTGRGEVDVQNMQLSIPASGPVHVNVYRNGDSLENVIACANLRLK